MNRTEKALELFKSGFNCAQAVLAVFSTEAGLEEEKALKLSCGFGAGMGRTDQVCGAVAGAVMALGLKYGMSASGEKEKKETTYAKVKEFTAAFAEKNKALTCTGLLGCNMSTKEGLEQAKLKEAHLMICPKFVQDAVELLEEIL